MGFGSAYVATSFALSMLAPVPAAVWRSALAAAVLASVALVRHRLRAGERIQAPAPSTPVPSPAGRAARLLVIAAVGGPLFLASMNLAVAQVGATIAAFVAGLYAVLAAVIAPALLPERLTPRVLAGFLLALGGTAMLAELDPTGTDAAGLAWGLLAATSFALYLVLTRRWSAPLRLDGLTIGLTNLVLTALVLGAIVLATDGPALVPVGVSPEAVAAMAWLAAVAALGPVLTVASVRRIPAARSAAFLLLNPVTATILAAILLAERPSGLQMAGGLLVLAGMAVVTIPLGAVRSPRGPGVVDEGPAG